ncbi:hypothetical protein BG004_006827 [Podila humilis]|nr:hypothetical protein BG004_006827 [Podila humilis]
MSSLIVAAESTLQAHVTHRAKQLANLAESIGYPHSLSSEHIPAIRSTLQHEYNISAPVPRPPGIGAAFSASTFRSSLAQPPTTHGIHGTGQELIEASSAAKFVEWLLDNVAPETNWTGYPGQSNSIDSDLSRMNFDRQADNNSMLHVLDREHEQLQNTLASLEQELADLQSVESESLNTAKVLNMETHDTSIAYDSTLDKLDEVAHRVYSKYDPNGTAQRGVHVHYGEQKDPEFLYIHQQELEHLNEIDKQLLNVTKSVQKHIVANACTDLATSSISSTQQQTLPKHQQQQQFELFDQLLKQDPTQDKELIRLCAVYRATKMSHIRAMAQLQSLEEQIRYMSEIDDRLTLQQREEDERLARDGELTGDYTYTIATAKNKVIQQSRQQEIELISVQREKSRLADELEQLLSEPTTSGHATGSNLAIEVDEIDPTRQGVLVDICERIARTDIELLYISTAHEDLVESQEGAVKDLCRVVEQLLEYYGYSQIVEQALTQEQVQIQHHKDVLWALIQELDSHNSSSTTSKPLSLHQSREAPSLNSTTPSRDDKFRALFSTLRKHQELKTDIQKEQDVLVENVDQLLKAKMLLLHNVVYQHSATNQLQFEPAHIRQAKDTLVHAVEKSQQEYSNLESQVHAISVTRR